MKYLTYLIILALVALLIIQNQCQHPKQDNQPVSDTIMITSIIFDTITIHDTAYQPKYIYKDTGTTKIIYDTVLILKDYFTKYFYSDTILNDTSAQIIINDTIYKNRIISRLPKVKLYHPVITNTILTSERHPERSRRVSAGFTIGGNLNQFNFGPALLLQTKKKTSYSLSYDLINKQVNLSLYWQLF